MSTTTIDRLELIARREALGFSRADLAAELGVSFDSVKSWELGRHRVPAGVRDDLARLETAADDAVDAIIEAGVVEWPMSDSARERYQKVLIGRAFAEGDGDLRVVEELDPMALLD